jgi:hypothetical protein
MISTSLLVVAMTVGSYHDERRFAAELERDGGEVLRGAGCDLLAGADRAGSVTSCVIGLRTSASPSLPPGRRAALSGRLECHLGVLLGGLRHLRERLPARRVDGGRGGLALAGRRPRLADAHPGVDLDTGAVRLPSL